MNGERGSELAQRTKDLRSNYSVVFSVAKDGSRSGDWRADTAKRDFGWCTVPRGDASGSTAEFVSKVEAALQELEETRYWLELLMDAELIAAQRLRGLHEEATQLVAILVASAKTAKRGNARGTKH